MAAAVAHTVLHKSQLSAVTISLTLQIIMITGTFCCPLTKSSISDGPRFSRQTALATEDLISYLQSLEVNYPQVGHVIDMLIATPQVQELIDRLLLRWPELPKIVKGLEVFLRGRDGKAIAQAFEQVIPSIVQALFALYDKILVYVEEAGEALAEQGVRLFFHLRSPEVKESICKLMELPEIKILGVYLEEFNINLVQVFDKLQVVLTE